MQVGRAAIVAGWCEAQESEAKAKRSDRFQRRVFTSSSCLLCTSDSSTELG